MNLVSSEHFVWICGSWENTRGCHLWQLSVAQNDCAETVCELIDIATKANHESMIEHEVCFLDCWNIII